MKKLFFLILACLMLAAVSCPAFAGFDGAEVPAEYTLLETEDSIAAARGYVLYLKSTQALREGPGTQFALICTGYANDIVEDRIDTENGYTDTIAYDANGTAWRFIRLVETGVRGWVLNSAVTSTYVSG